MENRTITNNRRKTIERRHTFFVGLSITIVAAVLYLSMQLTPRLTSSNIEDARKIEKVIASKYEQLSDIANSWLRTNDTSQKAAFAILDDKQISKLNKDGVGVFLYSNNKLQAWSCIPDITESTLTSIDTSLRLYSSNNAWFLASRINKNGKSAIVSIEIQKRFRFTNKFLENKFNNILPIPPQYELSHKFQQEPSLNTIAVKYNNRVLFGLEKEKNIATSNATKELVAYLSLLLLIVGGWLTIQSLSFRRHYLQFFVSLTAGSMLCVGLMYILGQQPSSLLLFSPKLFSSYAIPSLAALAVYALVFVAAISTVYSHFIDYRIKSKRIAIPLAIVLSAILASLVIVAHLLIRSLVENSAISFGIIKISEISRYSMIVYLIIASIIISIVLLTNLFTHLFKELSLRIKVAMLAVPLVAASCTILPNDPSIVIFGVIALAAYAIFLYWAKGHSRISISSILLVLVIWAIGASTIVCHFVVTKDVQNRTKFAELLYNEKDPIVEAMLPELTQQILKDKEVHRLIHNPSDNDSIIYQHIRKKVIRGYLSKYNLHITICPAKAELFLPNEKKKTSCQEYFHDLFKQKGTKVENSAFYLIRNFPGEIWYIGQLDYLCSLGLTSLYLELNVKTISSNPGYPELLLKRDEPRNKSYKDYEYAHYFDSSLVAKNGTYSYPSIITPPTKNDSIQVHVQKGYSNLYYRFDEHNTMVVSRPILSFFDIASCFSYIFIFLVFTGLIILKFSRVSLDEALSLQSFKGRITLSFVVVLIATLILTAIASLAYGIRRFEAYKEQTIQDKMKSAIPAVYNALYSPNPVVLTNELVKISNYLYVDVNLYDLNGELYATSRPEIFYDGLQGFKMSPKAFKSLALSYDGFFVDNEKIGSMTYTSSYSPIYDNNGKRIGYVNLPYFMQYDNLRKELYTIAITIANIFILLLLPVIFIAVLISNSITRPLAQIRNRMRTFDLKKNPEPIPYQKNDEIGDLIVEFNKMICQVEASAQMLANTERDLAWREMARQIAHEIKNPLTPMKLSLQYLMMLKNKKDDRWLDQFDRFATSQVEQIDSLAKIASEFSDFAKISFEEHSTIHDLKTVVNEVLPIFDGYPNLTFTIDMPEEPAYVRAGREHLKRVVVNLVKNATQSVEHNDAVAIRISITVDEEKVTLSVEDNGKGIPEEVKPKLFTPNFTTKSSGTGLGLAISKNLIEAYSGRIWFESEEGKGSTFAFELPRKRKRE